MIKLKNVSFINMSQQDYLHYKEYKMLNLIGVLDTTLLIELLANFVLECCELFIERKKMQVTLCPTSVRVFFDKFCEKIRM